MKRPRCSNGRPSKIAKVEQEESEPRFSFDEVKSMIEKLLSQQKRISAAFSVGLKQANFDEIAIPGHSVQGCKDLIERLVKSTRRIRTLQEVLTDIKDNLNKRTYTEIIHRASLEGDAPKRPPTAYLLYHQDRYDQLKHEIPLAAEVSKKVAEEWRNLSDKKRREYHRRHNELMNNYVEELQRLGLVDEAAPKRPKSARAIYIAHRMNEMGIDETDKDNYAQAKEEFAQEFENLDKSEKKQWNHMLNQEMLEYQEARERYMAAHPHLDHTVPEKSRPKQKSIAPPAAPKSAAKFFLHKKMPEGLEGQEFEEMKKKLKDKFHTLPEHKLLKYVKKAVKDKNRYEAELLEFKAKYPDVAIPKLKPNITKEQMKFYMNKVENRPTPPAPNAYLHFCGRTLSEIHSEGDDTQHPTARMQNASNAWKELSDMEREYVKAEHLNAVENFINDMERWLASQSDERRKQIVYEEPKQNPDYWRKKLGRMIKSEKKRTKQSIFR